MLLCFLLCLLISVSMTAASDGNDVKNDNTTIKPTIMQSENLPEKSTIMTLFTPTNSKSAGPCRYLQATRRQNHQCRRDFGLPEALKEARRLAVTHCEDQFKYDRWNCSIETRGKRNIFQKVYRETAFVHALTAAALTYSVARACSQGRMIKCQCAQEKRPENARMSWRWGGCSDNIKHGKRSARNFLELHTIDGDQIGDIMRHNSEVGIQTAVSTVTEKCKCHGVSGSCSMKTCWRKLPEFNQTAAMLRVKYHRAIRKFPTNKSTRRSLAELTRKRSDIESASLFYLETSPTFCAVTKGRNCQHPDNCATLCCGRGYSTHLVKIVEKCRCRFHNGRCCHVVCDECERFEDRYYCK